MPIDLPIGRNAPTIRDAANAAGMLDKNAARETLMRLGRHYRLNSSRGRAPKTGTIFLVKWKDERQGKHGWRFEQRNWLRRLFFSRTYERESKRALEGLIKAAEIPDTERLPKTVNGYAKPIHLSNVYKYLCEQNAKPAKKADIQPTSLAQGRPHSPSSQQVIDIEEDKNPLGSKAQDPSGKKPPLSQPSAHHKPVKKDVVVEPDTLSATAPEATSKVRGPSKEKMAALQVYLDQAWGIIAKRNGCLSSFTGPENYRELGFRDSIVKIAEILREIPEEDVAHDVLSRIPKRYDPKKHRLADEIDEGCFIWRYKTQAGHGVVYQAEGRKLLTPIQQAFYLMQLCKKCDREMEGSNKCDWGVSNINIGWMDWFSLTFQSDYDTAVRKSWYLEGPPGETASNVLSFATWYADYRYKKNSPYKSEDEARAAFNREMKKTINQAIENSKSNDKKPIILPFYVADGVFTEPYIFKIQQGKITDLIRSASDYQHQAVTEIINVKKSDAFQAYRAIPLQHDGNCTKYAELALDKFYFLTKIQKNDDITVFDEMKKTAPNFAQAEEDLWSCSFLNSIGCSFWKRNPSSDVSIKADPPKMINPPSKKIKILEVSLPKERNPVEHIPRQPNRPGGIKLLNVYDTDNSKADDRSEATDQSRPGDIRFVEREKITNSH